MGSLVEMKTKNPYTPIIEDAELLIKKKDRLKEAMKKIYDYVPRGIEILINICESEDSSNADKIKATNIILAKGIADMASVVLENKDDVIDVSNMTDEELNKTFMNGIIG